MKRMPFEPPTDHYDDRISSIDEQICALIKQRKEVSSNPGFPYPGFITSWAEKYELYDDLLKSVFGTLSNEKQFRPFVEPNEFLKHLHILKSVEKDSRLYTVPFIRQFDNASVVVFNIDWDVSNCDSGNQSERSFFELFIGEHYDCRMIGGSGSSGHHTYNFIVSPPLPDDISGLELVFKEFSRPLNGKPTGFEIIMKVD